MESTTKPVNPINMSNRASNLHSPLIKCLLVSFDLPIHPAQIPQWRGAFIELAGIERDTFHNHDNGRVGANNKDFYHYRYPLIQYRMVQGNAAIFAINEGVEVLEKVLLEKDWEINWRGSVRSLNVETVQTGEHILRMLNTPKAYRLKKWLGLNQKNYETWLKCDGLIEEVALLEKILATNLLMTCTSFGWRLPQRLEVRITKIHKEQWVRCHGDRMLAFSLTFKANIALPALLATGKSVSLGFGWVEMERMLPQHRFDKKRQGSSVV